MWRMALVERPQTVYLINIFPTQTAKEIENSMNIKKTSQNPKFRKKFY